MLKFKILGLALALVVVAGLVAVASGATGAYFSDTKSGEITGTIGSVKVDTSDLTLRFSNLMPGEPQTVTLNYANAGTGNQDIWMVFPQPDALHAINDLGTYGEVKIQDSNTGVVFFSNNLNDRPNNGTTPIPRTVQLVSNIPAGGSGTMSFTFMYAGKLTIGGGGVWNIYPLPALSYYTPTPGITLGSLNGLPYQIVATQVGQTP
jgi:hypothetical protein